MAQHGAGRLQFLQPHHKPRFQITAGGDDGLHREHVVGGVGRLDAHVAGDARSAGVRPDRTELFSLNGRHHPNVACALEEHAVVAYDVEVMLDTAVKKVQPFQDHLDLLRRHVKLHPAEQVGRVVHPVARQIFQNVHHRFAVAPGVHEQRVEPGLVGGHAKPEQVAVESLQLGHQHANRLGAGRGGDTRQLLHAQHVGQGVNVRANAADAFQQVQILRPGARFGCFFDAAMGIAQPHRAVGDNLAIHGKFKVGRFFQGRVLRANGYDEFVAARFNGSRGGGTAVSLHGTHIKILAQRIDVRRPVVRQEKMAGVRCVRHRDAKHFHQLLLMHCRRRNEPAQAGHHRIFFGQRHAQGENGRIVAKVIQYLQHLAVQPGDGG